MDLAASRVLVEDEEEEDISDDGCSGRRNDRLPYVCLWFWKWWSGFRVLHSSMPSPVRRDWRGVEGGCVCVKRLDRQTPQCPVWPRLVEASQFPHRYNSRLKHSASSSPIDFLPFPRCTYPTLPCPHLSSQPLFSHDQLPLALALPFHRFHLSLDLLIHRVFRSR